MTTFGSLLDSARKQFGPSVQVRRDPNARATTVTANGKSVAISDDLTHGMTLREQAQMMAHMLRDLKQQGMHDERRYNGGLSGLQQQQGQQGFSGLTGQIQWPPGTSTTSTETFPGIKAALSKPPNQTLTEETAQALVKAVADMAVELSALRATVERLQAEHATEFTRLADAYAND